MIILVYWSIYFFMWLIYSSLIPWDCNGHSFYTHWGASAYFYPSRHSWSHTCLGLKGLVTTWPALILLRVIFHVRQIDTYPSKLSNFRSNKKLFLLVIPTPPSPAPLGKMGLNVSYTTDASIGSSVLMLVEICFLLSPRYKMTFSRKWGNFPFRMFFLYSLYTRIM